MESITRRLPLPDTRRCAFTGYRSGKLPFGYSETCEAAIEFKERLYDHIENLILASYGHFISSGAQGYNLIAAETVMELKNVYLDTTLEMAIPFDAQAERWASNYRACWQACVDKADIVTVLSHAYTQDYYSA